MQPHNYESSTHTSSSRASKPLTPLLTIIFQHYSTVTSSIHVYIVDGYEKQENTIATYLMCGLFVVAKMLFSPLSTYYFIPPKMQYFSSGSLVSFYNRCPFQGGKQHLYPRLKTINILTKYNIIYSTFDTSNFNFSESEWLEIRSKREKEIDRDAE